MTPNIIDELGVLAIGARMRRLYDVLTKDVTRIYQEHGFPLEAKDFILYYLISKRKKISISDISKELNLTHPAIIHLAKSLEKMGYIESEKSVKDSRKRYLKLTKKGLQDVSKYKPLWSAITVLNVKLFQEQVEFLQAIQKLERIIEEQSFYQRYHVQEGIKRGLRGLKKSKVC